MKPELEYSLNLVLREREKQNKKWGEQNHDSYRWLAILGEEFGELSQAILHDEFGGKAAGTTREELIQVVAVGLQWLECIERKSFLEWNQKVKESGEIN